jgi:glutamine cyclotransferase
VSNLNELEYVEGEIYANVWYDDRIVRISPQTGQVVGWVDLSTLYPARQRPSRDAVLNGIAYDAQQRRLFVTGKNWPRLFEIRISP